VIVQLAPLTAPAEGFSGNAVWYGFQDGRSDTAYYTAYVPYRRAAGTDIGIEIRWLNDDVTKTGKVLWKCSYLSAGAGDDPFAAGTTISKLSAGNHAQDEELATTLDTGIESNKLTTGDELYLKIWRDGTDGTDTFANTAKLLAVHLHFIKDKLGKALP